MEKDALWVWRHYNKRADCENVIKELQHGFGISGLICERFHATEAALSLAVVCYNLTVLFQRRLGVADQGNHPVPAILDFCYRRTYLQSSRTAHHQVRRP